MDDAIISNNKAQSGAAIYVITQRLSNDSYIRNTTFENNFSEENGAAFLDFEEGIMEISGNRFVNNRGAESCIAISNNANTDINPSYAKIANNLF